MEEYVSVDEIRNFVFKRKMTHKQISEELQHFTGQFEIRKYWLFALGKLFVVIYSNTASGVGRSIIGGGGGGGQYSYIHVHRP